MAIINNEKYQTGQERGALWPNLRHEQFLNFLSGSNTQSGFSFLHDIHTYSRSVSKKVATFQNLLPAPRAKVRIHRRWQYSTLHCIAHAYMVFDRPIGPPFQQ